VKCQKQLLPTGCADPTKDFVQSTGFRHQILECDGMQHCHTCVTHLVGLLHTASTAGNPTTREPMVSVEDIRAIAKLETTEDAIMMAQDEIDCLDNLALE
jgi:hypothetical protein